jgi:hypothetical protein
MLDFLFRNPVQRLPTPILAVTLHRLFLALEYVDSLMQGIDDEVSLPRLVLVVSVPGCGIENPTFLALDYLHTECKIIHTGAVSSSWFYARSFAY